MNPPAEISPSTLLVIDEMRRLFAEHDAKWDARLARWGVRADTTTTDSVADPDTVPVPVPVPVPVDAAVSEYTSTAVLEEIDPEGYLLRIQECEKLEEMEVDAKVHISIGSEVLQADVVSALDCTSLAQGALSIPRPPRRHPLRRPRLSQPRRAPPRPIRLRRPRQAPPRPPRLHRARRVRRFRRPWRAPLRPPRLRQPWRVPLRPPWLCRPRSPPTRGPRHAPPWRRRPFRRLIWRPPWRLASFDRRPRRHVHRVRGCSLRPDPEAGDALRARYLSENLNDALCPTLPEFGHTKLGPVDDLTSVRAWSGIDPTPIATGGAEGYALRFSTESSLSSMAVPELLFVARLPFISTLFPHVPRFASRPAMAADAVLSAKEVAHGIKDVGWQLHPADFRRLLDSSDTHLAPGDLVWGITGWEDYGVGTLPATSRDPDHVQSGHQGPLAMLREGYRDVRGRRGAAAVAASMTTTGPEPPKVLLATSRKHATISILADVVFNEMSDHQQPTTASKPAPVFTFQYAAPSVSQDVPKQINSGSIASLVVTWASSPAALGAQLVFNGMPSRYFINLNLAYSVDVVLTCPASESYILQKLFVRLMVENQVHIASIRDITQLRPLPWPSFSSYATVLLRLGFLFCWPEFTQLRLFHLWLPVSDSPDGVLVMQLTGPWSALMILSLALFRALLVAQSMTVDSCGELMMLAMGFLTTGKEVQYSTNCLSDIFLTCGLNKSRIVWDPGAQFMSFLHSSSSLRQHQHGVGLSAFCIQVYQLQSLLVETYANGTTLAVIYDAMKTWLEINLASVVVLDKRKSSSESYKDHRQKKIFKLLNCLQSTLVAAGILQNTVVSCSGNFLAPVALISSINTRTYSMIAITSINPMAWKIQKGLLDTQVWCAGGLLLSTKDMQVPWDPGGTENLHRLGGKPNLKKGGMSGVTYGWATKWALGIGPRPTQAVAGIVCHPTRAQGSSRGEDHRIIKTELLFPTVPLPPLASPFRALSPCLVRFSILHPNCCAKLEISLSPEIVYSSLYPNQVIC